MVAEARVRQARSAREVARSLLFPRIGVGASALRFRGSESLIELPGADLTGNLFQVGFDAEWTAGRVRWHPYPDVPAVAAVSNGAYQHEPVWYRRFLYAEERARDTALLAAIEEERRLS